MSADGLIARLDGVKRTGSGRWIARCPGHDDKSPSLSIRELDDGRILLHDFAGCDVEQILDAAGLTFDALFPERSIEHGKPERRSFPAADVLETIASEASIVAVAACNIRQGIALSDADHERLLVATERIYQARRLANGERR